MNYVIKTCLDSDLFPKCKGCPHHRIDPERRFEEDERDRYACYLDEDLQGEERIDYLLRLRKHFSGKDFILQEEK